MPDFRRPRRPLRVRPHVAQPPRGIVAAAAARAAAAAAASAWARAAASASAAAAAAAARAAIVRAAARAPPPRRRPRPRPPPRPPPPPCAPPPPPPPLPPPPPRAPPPCPPTPRRAAPCPATCSAAAAASRASRARLAMVALLGASRFLFAAAWPLPRGTSHRCGKPARWRKLWHGSRNPCLLARKVRQIPHTAVTPRPAARRPDIPRWARAAPAQPGWHHGFSKTADSLTRVGRRFLKSSMDPPKVLRGPYLGKFQHVITEVSLVQVQTK